MDTLSVFVAFCTSKSQLSTVVCTGRQQHSRTVVKLTEESENIKRAGYPFKVNMITNTLELSTEFTRRLSTLNPDSKVHGANMGPTWVLSVPDGPHDGPMNLAIRVLLLETPFT